MSAPQASDGVVLVAEDGFDIDAVRAHWRGRELGRSSGRYPVEHDPIRRFCHMTGQTDARYLDPDAGPTPCPPMLLRYFVRSGAWPPGPPEPWSTPPEIPRLGDRGVNMGTRWTLHAEAFVGDRLHADWTVRDVYVKPTRLDPLSVWIETEATIANQRDEPVASWANTVLFHRPPDGSAAPPAPERRTAEDEPGTVAFTAELTPTASYLQVSGTQDWNLLHHDEDYARSGGHESTFFSTAWTQGLLGRIAEDVLADGPGRLTGLEFRMRRTNRPGDTVRALRRTTGTTTREDGTTVSTMEVALANDRAGVTTRGTATVEVPAGEQA